jgi:hypothetical protein
MDRPPLHLTYQTLTRSLFLPPPYPCPYPTPCQVLLSTVNEAAMVPFVSGQLNNLELALALARRGNLPGAESLIVQLFEKQFAGGQFKEAAETAAESPQVGRGVGGRGGAMR